MTDFENNPFRTPRDPDAAARAAARTEAREAAMAKAVGEPPRPPSATSSAATTPGSGMAGSATAGASQTNGSRRGGFWAFGRFVVATIVLLFAGLGMMVFATVVGLVTSLGNIEAPVAPSLPDEITLSFALAQPMTESRAGGGLASLVRRTPTVPEFVTIIDAAAEDDRVQELVMRIEPMPMSLAHVQEMRAAISRFREAGKTARVFSFSMGDFTGGTGPYYLASAFDEIWLQPVGGLALTGIGTEMPFAADLLARFNVEFESFQREEFKNLMAQYTESDMPPAQREAMEDLIGDLYDQLVDDIAADRGLPPETVKALIDQAPLTANMALEGGLIDRVGYRDEFLEDAAGEVVSLVAYGEQLAIPTAKENGIAYIQATGPIMQGLDSESALFSGNMRTHYLDRVLSDVIDDDAIKAVVFRLDSPGGSPAASEFVRRALTRVSDAGKPVVVSMGRAAASGGYWIATGADALVAQPGTITGSIGVVAGKPNLEQFWEEWDVNWVEISRGDNARIISPNQPFDASDRAAMDRSLDDIYDSFLARVAEARGFSVDEARALAKGRVWTGRQAFQVGLVDELGGIETAYDRAIAAAGLEPQDATLVPYPRPSGRFETVFELVTSLGGIMDGFQILSDVGQLAKNSGVTDTLELLQDPNLASTPDVMTR
ncbi:MAG: signal peptide peptidase SppA [Pseudomonadota bacterium]